MHIFDIFLQSLKKEMDWDRSDDKSIGESSSDYRHPHDSVSLFIHFVVLPTIFVVVCFCRKKYQYYDRILVTFPPIYSIRTIVLYNIS